MNFALIKNKIRHGSFLFPFRFHFVLLIIILLAAYYWLKQNTALPDSSYTAILDLFITITLAFTSAVFLISFITSVVPWIFFLINKKQIVIKVKTNKETSINDKQQLAITISPILRPLFGYIRIRLHYDDKNISPKFSLINKKIKKQFISTEVTGIFNWHLPEIKEYKVSNVIIYFEDMFQFFSFAAALPAQDNFITQPLNKETRLLKIQPKKTEETNTRIEQIRKIEGEFLNYKNFEHNDDVRRIVWKIYAKNKELVVRIPETNDTYASHIYFYASFYNEVAVGFYSELYAVFLNYYKTAVWNTYHQLTKQNVLVKYIPDQETKKTFADDPAEKTKYIVSTSDWQTQKELQQYLKKEDATIVCISSLINFRDLELILEKRSKDPVIVFVKLSNLFNTVHLTDWIQWLFVNPRKDSIDQHRITWNRSLIKRTVTDNEQKILNILNKSENEIVIV